MQTEAETDEKFHRTDWLEQLVLHNRFSRILIGSSIAQLAYVMMSSHAAFTSFNEVMTFAAGIILFSAGMTLTLRPVVEEWTWLVEDVKNV